MGNKARKTHCSQKELQCKQWVMKEDLHKELHCKKMGIEARKTHCSHKELQCKQWVMKEDLHKELHCKKRELKQGRLIVHTRCNNANNG
ncbi:hypothetical protein KSS87_007897 [Heliosperma pusillum]|nr:hypothetical protein KSS87_007897 [Heliosperma pusillum]